MQPNSPIPRAVLSYLRHELCTPINAMIGYSEILLEDLQTQPALQPESTLVEDLQKINACSNQLLRLVTTILDPAQLELSQIDGDLDGFGSTLRMELLTPLSTIMGYCEMSLEEAPAELISDLDKLNASAQQLLSLVNDIIDLAQQQLQTFNAQADHTAPLFLESPIVQSAATTLETLNQESPGKPPQGGMILVVDDNPTNCDLLCRQLKRHGHTITTASNAQQALRLLKAIPYDLMLLDVIMPGMNGIELLQQLKRHDDWRHIPVIMISALDELEGAVKCIELGAEDYLSKPFDPTLLKARIGAYLEKKRLRDQEILYLQQVKRLTTAAAAVETKTFDPASLNDLTRDSSQLGQLARVFQRMAQEVNSRERHLEQQVHRLQVVIDEGQKKRIVADIAATDHFRQIQKRTNSSRDIENLYRSSLYPPLSRFAADVDVASSEEQAEVKRPALPAISSPHDVSASTIVAVHSFRGGTGKSNLTSNLAISVAKQGKRVGIIDIDLPSPGMHVLFGLDDETIDQTLNDYLWGRCALYEAAYDLSHLLSPQPSHRTSHHDLHQDSHHTGSLYLVPASARANDMTRILREGFRPELLLDGFSEVIRDLQLDVLLIDTHPGMDAETLQAIAACSLLVVVLRPDYQDYQGTSVIVELARMLSVAEMLLVVNKALPMFDLATYRQQLEAAYEVSVADILPFAEEMMQLASSEIFCVRYPDHPLATAIEAIGRLIEQKQTALLNSL